jgi:hypothetical protein
MRDKLYYRNLILGTYLYDSNLFLLFLFRVCVCVWYVVNSTSHYLPLLS